MPTYNTTVLLMWLIDENDNRPSGPTSTEKAKERTGHGRRTYELYVPAEIAITFKEKMKHLPSVWSFWYYKRTNQTN